jgi:hypothetical protein
MFMVFYISVALVIKQKDKMYQTDQFELP